VFVNLVKCNSKALKNVNLILIGLNYLFAYRKTRIVGMELQCATAHSNGRMAKLRWKIYRQNEPNDADEMHTELSVSCTISLYFRFPFSSIHVCVFVCVCVCVCVCVVWRI